MYTIVTGEDRSTISPERSKLVDMRSKLVDMRSKLVDMTLSCVALRVVFICEMTHSCAT